MKIRLILCLSAAWWAGIAAAVAQQGAKDWYAKGLDANHSSQKIEFFTKAIALDPNYVEAYDARAAARFGLGMAKEAVQDFNQSIRIDPSRAFTFYSRASCQLALGKYEAAVADFDQVIQLQPGHVYAMSGKGCALLAQGKPTDAVSVLEETLALDGTVQSAVKCREEAFKKLGRKSNASTVANKSIKGKPAEADKTETGSLKLNITPSIGAYKITEATSLREGPTHTTRILARFNSGDAVEVLEKTDEFWWKVRYKGKVGYAKAAALASVD